MDKGVYDFCAVSSRIRLARNLKRYLFSVSAAGYRNRDIAAELAAVLRTRYAPGSFRVCYMDEIGDLDEALLTAKHILSPNLKENRRTGALVLFEGEKLSIMVNEEDHLREQCVSEGLSLDKAYKGVKELDHVLSSRMDFARDDRFGYITACLTNFGTGMRASVMLFLPALERAGRIPALIDEMRRNGMAVRGVLGEGSVPLGCLYQVSNEVTLGFSEEEIISAVNFAAKKIIRLEIEERNYRMEADPLSVMDGCCRAYGVLANCRSLDYDEFCGLFAGLSTGIYYGLFPQLELSARELNALLVNMRPAVLAFRTGITEKSELCRIRADAMRNILNPCRGDAE